MCFGPAAAEEPNYGGSLKLCTLVPTLNPIAWDNGATEEQMKNISK